MANLIPTTNYADLKDVDLVIEAVFEDLGLKHKVIKELEQVSCAICWVCQVNVKCFHTE